MSSLCLLKPFIDWISASVLSSYLKTGQMVSDAGLVNVAKVVHKVSEFSSDIILLRLSEHVNVPLQRIV